MVMVALSVAAVADPGCLSRIPDPEFYPSRIPDPGSRIQDPKTATKERGEKKFVVIPFFVATNFIQNYFSFDMLKKKIWANFQRIMNFFPKKWSLSSQKYGIGIRETIKLIPDPGSRGQKGTESWI